MRKNESGYSITHLLMVMLVVFGAVGGVAWAQSYVIKTNERGLQAKLEKEMKKTNEIIKGSLVEDNGEKKAIVIRHNLVKSECVWLNAQISGKKEVSNIKVNPENERYSNVCQSNFYNTVIYEQKIVR